MDWLAPLDWSRQAAVGGLEGLGGILEGDWSRRNFAKVLPAAAGLAAGVLTGGLGAVPVGAAVGGLMQGYGNATNEDMFRAKSTPDVVRAIGGDPDSWIQNALVGAVTDPWTYAGVGAGAARGSKIGKALEEATVARGPMYETSAGDFHRMLGNYLRGENAAGRYEYAPRNLPPFPAGLDSLQEIFEAGRHGAGAEVERWFNRVFPQAPGRLERAAGSELGPFHGVINTLDRMHDVENYGSAALETPIGNLLRGSGFISDRALRELHPGSEIIGHGAERLAFRTPGGQIVGIGADASPIPKAAGLLDFSRVARTHPFLDKTGHDLGLTITHGPQAAGVGTLDKTQINLLRNQLADQGIVWSDFHPWNAGYVGQTPTVIDPGGVRALAEPTMASIQRPALGGSWTRGVEQLPAFAGEMHPVTTIGPNQAGSPFVQRLASLLNTKEDLRNALEAGNQYLGYDRVGGQVGALAGLGAGFGANTLARSLAFSPEEY